jgi:hypothetical protein
MAAVEIDIRTRVWLPEERIFVLFPGKEHALYDTFANRSLVFLEVPGLVLEPGKQPKDHADYAARLKLSDDIRVWFDKAMPLNENPSRDLADYKDAQIGKRRALLASQVGTLYGEIKTGDLIVVPGKNYFADTLIGEVVDEPLKYTTAEVPDYPGEKVIARRVRWAARVPKWRFSPDMIRRLQLPNPLTLLEKSLWDEVLRVAYENYVYDGRFNARFLTTKADFSSLDSLNIEFLLSLVGAVEAKSDLGGEGNVSTIDAALDLLAQHMEYAPELVININSPGDISAYSKKIVPLVAAAMLALALSPQSAAAAADIHIVNSVAPADNCSVVVDSRVKDVINMYGYQRWQEQCRRLKGTRERTGLTTQIKVHQKPDGHH